MFTIQAKREISSRVQAILREIADDELPDAGEIQFILHVDGEEDWSWANIMNNGAADRRVPGCIVRNLNT